MSILALLGGPKTVRENVPQRMFHWPIINKAMEKSVLSVLRNGTMSKFDQTKKFEHEFAKWHGVKYALAHPNGTSALEAAMYGLGVGAGDEVICPGMTYWASCAQALSLRASVVFADIDPKTLCIDPDDIERRITKRTKLIIVVHFLGYPADMDRIMSIARKHGIKVLEDVSHAHGALYKGKLVGTFGDAAGFSMMSGKSFAVGEAGVMITDQREVYERAILFGLYARHKEIEDADLKALSGLPLGGRKNRMNQLSAAIGIEQIKKYPAEMAEINCAMNYFWDLLEGVPGLDAHRPAAGNNMTKGGWYGAHGLYNEEELGGLSLNRFCEAVRAEGCAPYPAPGCYKPLHTHSMFISADIYHEGKPTNLLKLPAGSNNKQGPLPVTEALPGRTYFVPWFKKYIPEIIEEYADAFRKVAENYKDLIKDDKRIKKNDEHWGLTYAQR